MHKTTDKVIDKKLSEIVRLESEIKRHNDLYYNHDAPEISDYEYDMLLRELYKLKGEVKTQKPSLPIFDSVTDSVGAPINTNTNTKLPKIKHSRPMLSLDNAFNFSEVLDFLKRASVINKDVVIDQKNGENKIAFPQKYEFLCEPKIDGLSFSATYKDGKLVKGGTRGDGEYGEDITENLKYVANFPQEISYKKDLEVRGEVYMKKDDFIKLNEQRANEEKPLFANPRNAAAGSLRQLDARITGNRHLQYFIWGGYIDDVHSQQELLEKFKSLNFCVNSNIKIAKSFDDIKKYYEYMSDQRSHLSYDIDGLVYKINDFDVQNKLGFATRFPKWAIAHKFPGIEATSKILNIKVQVSRSGVLTPVAELEPINIGGVIVTRATLHNEDEIKRHDFRIGDTVKIKRAGDVIPKIISVDLSKRPANTYSYKMPDKCPVCGSSVILFEGETFKKCSGGLKCSAQVIEKLIHFVSQSGANIVGLGEKQIAQLHALHLVNQYSDFWKLKEKNDALPIDQRLEMHQGWGVKSFDNLINAIEIARTIDLNKLIYALGIRYVGEEIARLLAKHYGKWQYFYEKMKNIDEDEILTELEGINGIGEKTAAEIYKYFHDPYNISVIDNLLGYINVKNTESISTINTTNPIASSILVFTGSMKTQTRDQAKEVALSYGAKVTNSVSKNTTYLVIGDDPGSKLEKAKKLGVQILDENEWLEILKSIGAI